MKHSDFRERLLARAGRANLTVEPGVVEALEAYYNLLTHRNKRINLTSLSLDRLTDQALERLILEPLTAASYVEDRPMKWFDLGSGGGSPAIPLKIARPRTRLMLVESRSRKAAFLREVVRELQLSDVEVIENRIEGLISEASQPSADLITIRAVRLDRRMLTLLASFLIVGGQLLFFGADVTPPPDSDLVLKDRIDLIPNGPSRLFIFVKRNQD